LQGLNQGRGAVIVDLYELQPHREEAIKLKKIILEEID
jgi:hypothetical protein